MACSPREPHDQAAVLQTAVRVEQPCPGGADVRPERLRAERGQPPAPECLDVVVEEQQDVAPRRLRASVVQRRPVEGPGIGQHADVGAVGEALDQGQGLRVGGSVVDQDDLNAGVHGGRRSDGVDAGAEEPRLVPKGDQDAHRDAGLVGPHNAVPMGSGPGRHARVVIPAAERLFDMVDRGGADGADRRVRAVAQHFGDVHDGVGSLGGGQRALVLERRRARGHQAGQMVCDLGSHGQGPADVGAGQEELG